MSVQTDLWDAQLADIYEITNRPDLDTMTTLALRQATLKAHSCAQFARDLVVTKDLNTDQSTGFTQITINTTTDFARFRNVSGVRLVDVNGNVLDNPFVEVVEIGDIYEPGYREQGIKKNNTCWLAGTNLNIYCAGGAYGAEVTWYQSPNLTRDTYDSWIAQLFPDVIVWEAAYFVFGKSGNEEQAKAAYVMLHGAPGMKDDGLYDVLKMNYLNTAGR